MDDSDERGLLARAASRRDWPLRRYRLGHEPGANLRTVTTAEERLAMMWPIALDAWSSAGKAVPDYPRSEMPMSTHALGEEPPRER